MSKNDTCTVPPAPLRLDATIRAPNGNVHHTLKFNYANLNERWCFAVRMEDVLYQGYTVELKRVDPKAERLAAKYPPHG